MKTKTEFVDFNDNSLAIGKRKQAYVRYVMSNGTSLELAKKQANKKFGFKPIPKLIIGGNGTASQMAYMLDTESNVMHKTRWDDSETYDRLLNEYRARRFDIVFPKR